MKKLLSEARQQLYWIVPLFMLRYGMVPFLLTVIIAILVFTLEHVVDSGQS